MHYTKAEAISLTNSASIKNKNGRKWEKIVEKTLQENNFLPDGNLVNSIFKTKTYDMYNGGKFFKKKIIDQWLPKFNDIVENKNSIGDSQITEFMIATDSLAQSKEFGDDYRFIALINEKPTDRFEKKLKKLSNSHPFHYYIGERGLKQYLDTLSNPVQEEKLPMGIFEMTNINDINKNDINRKLDMIHVHKLVDSLIAPMKNGSIRGLVRPFIGIIKEGGHRELVDAHHLNKAVEIVHEFTPYTITEVPVYYLTHLDGCTEEELTMLMSVINTLVKIWDTFDYVTLWEKTFGKLNQPDSQYPYTKLRECMKELNPDKPTAAPIVQAFCFEDRTEESDWGNNTKKIHYGQLSFDETKFNRKLRPIVDSVIKLRERIEKTRKVVGPKYQDSKLGEWVKTPTALSSVIRAFATEVSLRENEVTNKEAYFKALEDLANGYWDNQEDVIPSWNSKHDYEDDDYQLLSKFPRSGNDMKEMARYKIMASLVKKYKRELKNS